MNSIQTFSFNSVTVSFNQSGFLNATQIAKHFRKRPETYLKTEPTQQYIAALAEHLSITLKSVIDKNQLVIVRRGATQTGGGTWLHPKLAIHFARWLDPRFAVWCDEQIEEILAARLKPEPPLILPTLPEYAGDPKAEEKYLLLSEVYSALSVQASLAASGLVHRQTQEFLNVVYQRADCLQPKPTPTSLPATPLEPVPENDVLFYTEINGVQVATLFHDGTKYYLAKHLAEAAGLKWATQLENSKSYFTRLRHFRRGSAACWVSEQSASLWLGRKNPRRVSCPLQLAQTVECLGLLV